MKWSEWIEKWGMTSLKINAGFMEMEWQPKDQDRAAAWDLYVELITRSATQHLDPEHGEEKSALESIHALFPLTRASIKSNSRHCIEFTKIAVVVLNQIVRPFTSKWHRLCNQEAFSDETRRQEFREELRNLQIELRRYTKMLADMASVEDLTDLEEAARDDTPA